MVSDPRFRGQKWLDPGSATLKMGTVTQIILKCSNFIIEPRTVPPFLTVR
jgi:hypothetical protein